MMMKEECRTDPRTGHSGSSMSGKLGIAFSIFVVIVAGCALPAVAPGATEVAAVATATFTPSPAPTSTATFTATPTSTPAPTITPTPTPTPLVRGALLFEDNFDHNRYGWELYRPETWVEGDSLHVFPESDSEIWTLGIPLEFQDFIYETEVTRMEGALASTGGPNLRFRSSHDSDQFYVCGIHGSSGYDFAVVDRTVTPERWRTLKWEDSPVIDPGRTTHKMTVVAEGSTFQLWVDDVLIDSFTDNTYSSGEIGLGFPANAHLAFDYVRVWALPGSNTPTPTPTPIPRLRLPRLRVIANQIQNEMGEVVVVRGVVIADPAFLYRVDRHWTPADFEALAEEWGADIVRVPIHPDLWEHDEKYAETYLDPIVQWGETFGLYILLGWHAHGNPITEQVEDTLWGNRDPWHGNPYNPNLGLATSALATLAERYLDDPHVVFGTFNEPSYIDWTQWRPIAEELVDVIHAVNPKALVFVSGTDWGYDLSGAISDPVRRDNVVYETHPYPGKGEGWKTVVAQLAQVAPVFIGEWGFRPGHPDDNLNATSEDYGLPLIRFADEHGIGWTGWIWHPVWDPEMLVSWKNYTPTEFGLLVKSSLATKGD